MRRARILFAAADQMLFWQVQSRVLRAADVIIFIAAALSSVLFFLTDCFLQYACCVCFYSLLVSLSRSLLSRKGDILSPML